MSNDISMCLRGNGDTESGRRNRYEVASRSFRSALTDHGGSVFLRFGTFLKDFVNVARMPGNIGCPSSKSGMSVNRSHPFGQELTLGLLFLIVLSLDLQD